ncbi:MAG: cysteine desulfurase [Pedosphaera sp.]|nr:cysteine desulfurase [Pedosphaera sp.]
MSEIYFDYNATTALDPAVREAMLPLLGETWGNPSSVHRVGRAARAALDDARYRLAACWKCRPSEVVFTSGGTESNNLAILGTAQILRDHRRHLVATPVEHPAVLQSVRLLVRRDGFRVTWLPVDAFGRVTVEAVEEAIRPDTALVTVMAANNEIGTLQPVAAIGTLCRGKGVLFHTDAVQVFGKQPFTDIHQFNADLVSVCAHKFHGPKGAGALFVRSPLQPGSLVIGGAQENERRGGTENLAAIVGLVEAFVRFVPTPVFVDATLREWAEQLAQAAVAVPGVVRRGHPIQRLSNTVAFTVAGTDGMALVAGLDLDGICASSGSACSAGSLEPSHVLQAIDVPPAEANALIRFSLGRGNSTAEVRWVADRLEAIFNRLRCVTRR